MTQFASLAQQAVKPFKNAFHYLFGYNLDRLRILPDSMDENIANLQQAFLHREYALITFDNGDVQVGQTTKRISSSRFVLRDADNKIFYLIDVNHILTVELP